VSLQTKCQTKNHQALDLFLFRGLTRKLQPLVKEARLSDLEFKTSSDLKDIYFKFDQYDLDDASRDILYKNATFLKVKSPIAKIEIQGHCDERGTNNYNISLAERRAKSTKIYLVSLGVDPKRIHTISFGEEKPLCMENKEVCWSKNRRSHFRISG
jgi:peptidoglycan-associated lipoprotein